MRRDSFEFVPECKVIIAGNHKPNLGRVDKAIEERLILFPFERTFQGDEVDRQLPEKLTAELPRILAWTIEGAILYLRAGGGLGDKPEAARSEGAAYIEEQDRYGAWVAERLVFGPGLFTPSARLVSDYNAFAHSELAGGLGFRGGVGVSAGNNVVSARNSVVVARGRL